MNKDEAIKTLHELWRETNDYWYEETYKMAIEALRDKPKGEWILECDGGNECDNLYKCSMCGIEYGCEEYDKPNFCPNCGTDMRNGM